MNIGLELIRKFGQAYRIACKPVCKEFGLPQTAFDILMFLGNNPEYKTASDIVEIRNIKANLVSMHVDRLVKDGFLVREEAKDDRRKTLLMCTGKAGPVVEKGKKVQEKFMETLFENTDEEGKENFIKTLNIISHNMDLVIKEERTDRV